MLRPFTLDRPSTLGEVADLLTAHPHESVLYAGGTELLLLMKEGLIRPRRLIDVKTVRELDAITAENGTLTIGATVRHRGVERSVLVRERCPLVAGVARHVANVRVRNVGTVGGNLAFADPHSDLATLFLALDGTLHLWSRRGARDVPLANFIRGPYETAREEDEVLTSVRLRLWPAKTASAYLKFGVYERTPFGSPSAASVRGLNGSSRSRARPPASRPPSSSREPRSWEPRPPARSRRWVIATVPPSTSAR